MHPADLVVSNNAVEVFALWSSPLLIVPERRRLTIRTDSQRSGEVIM